MEVSHARSLACSSIVFFIVITSFARAAELTQAEAIAKARQYLATYNQATRAQLAAELNTYAGDIDAVIAALKPVAPAAVQYGFSGLQHFTVPELQPQYWADQLYYYVPNSYNPSQPTGLFIGLHGGGAGSSREAALGIVDPASGWAAYGYTLYIPNSPYIAVGPSAPWSDTDSLRWQMAGAEQYIAAVIRESQTRFNIDPNRIVISGESMGGAGAYAMGLRMADRFAAVQPMAGMWGKAYWRSALGTPFHILHGTYDATPPGDPELRYRPRYTDIAFARLAQRLLNIDHLMTHVYEEHPWGHTSGSLMEPGGALPGLERFFSWMTQQTRNPYQARVVAATPADGVVSSPHNRWVSINATRSGNILFDFITYGSTGDPDPWFNWKLLHQKQAFPGAVVDATYEGNNTFRVSTRNVTSCSLWIHPSMGVNFANPITINLNGQTVTRTITPSLVTALNSIERRYYDWGLIYHAVVSLNPVENTPAVAFTTSGSHASETSVQTDVTVALTNSSSSTIAVDYQVTGGSATRDQDYILADGTLIFAPGETSQQIPITILDDATPEGDETIELSLGNPTNAYLGPEITHLMTIVGGQELGNGIAAYNDFAWTDGQPNFRITTLTRGQSGNLLNYQDGSNTGVVLSIDDGGAGPIFLNRTSFEGQPSAATDAWIELSGRVDAHGYLESGSKNLTLTLSGLSPSARYEVVLYGSAGVNTYSGRKSLITITGATSFENRSTPGADFPGAAYPMTTIEAGYNSYDGHVARFDNVDPGPDGQVTIVVSHYYRTKFYINALALKWMGDEVPPAPAQMTSPTPGSTLTSSTATFTWNTGTGVSQYWLSIGSTVGGTQFYDQDRGTSLSATVSGLPTNGSTVYVRLKSKIGTNWVNSDYTYTATSASTPAQITSPTPGSTLTSSTTTFTWNTGTGVSQYWLSVGSTVGGTQFYDQDSGTSLSATVSGLPTDGSTVYVRLKSKIGTNWVNSDYTYTATSASTPAQITSPTPGSTLTSSTTTFTWNTGTGVSQYWLSVGSTVGGTQFYDQDSGTSLSATVSGLPTNASTVHVRLKSKIGTNWVNSDYTYTATSASTPAQITSPTPGSILTSSTTTFTWNTGTGVSQYWLSVGSTVGGTQFYDQDRGTSLSATVSGLPTNASTVHVRLKSKIGTNWVNSDYTYTATAGGPAQITSPTPGSTLTSSTTTFTWNTGTGVSQYWLYVGTTQGGNQLYDQDRGTNLSATVTGLPTNGSTIHVRLWSKIGSNWPYVDYTYVASSVTPAPAQITSPTPGSILSSATVTFTWNTGTGVSQYWLSVGSTVGGTQFYDQDRGTSLSATVSGLPTNGSTVYVRLKSKIGANWVNSDYTYTATSASTPAQITSPTPGSTLTSSTTTFTWNTGTGVSQYWLSVGSTVGGTQFYDQDRGTSLSATVSGLPTNGSTVYVRLKSKIGANWVNSDYTYTATSASTPAQITSPTPGSTLTSSTTTFTWNTGTGVSQYWLSVGSTVGGTQFYDQDRGTSLSATVSGLPTNGSTVYVRLKSKIGANWVNSDYTYTATSASTPAQITSPTPGSTLTSSTTTFTWNTGTGVSQYWLYVGTTQGGNQLYDQDRGTNLSATVTGLPTNGSTIHVRLWSKIGANWPYLDYTYVASSVTPTPAQMTSPTPGSTFTSSTVAFSWTAGSGVSQYWLYVGTTQGGNQLYDQDRGTNRSATVTGLPTNGSTIHVRLWSKIGSNWPFVDYTYKAKPTP